VMIGTFDSFELWSPENQKKAGGIGQIDQENLKDAARYVGF
jgi:hypothetical protein